MREAAIENCDLALIGENERTRNVVERIASGIRRANFTRPLTVPEKKGSGE